MTLRTRLFALFVVAAPLSGCAGGEDRRCNADADCASGRCLPDGTCAPVDAGPAIPDAVAEEDAGPRDGGAPEDAALDADLPGCVPSRDGTIERLEVPLEVGLRATFRVAEGATVSTAGEPLGGGARRWDLSSALSGDRDVLAQLRPLGDAWYAPDFAGATYVTELSVREDLLGVFELSASELALRGVASPDDGFTRTSVRHDPPVPVLRFPLREGDGWRVDATVTGVSLGVVAAWTERYEYEVDAHGELVTPFGTFDVLRIRVTLTRTVGVLTTVIRSFAFVAECFGTVATITSEDGESRAEFTRAAEVRRLAP